MAKKPKPNSSALVKWKKLNKIKGSYRKFCKEYFFSEVTAIDVNVLQRLYKHQSGTVISETPEFIPPSQISFSPQTAIHFVNNLYCL